MDRIKDKRGKNGKDRKWGLRNSEKIEKRIEKNRRGHRRKRVEGIFYGIVKKGVVKKE